jgi:hypothetical protein
MLVAGWEQRQVNRDTAHSWWPQCHHPLLFGGQRFLSIPTSFTLLPFFLSQYSVFYPGKLVTLVFFVFVFLVFLLLWLFGFCLEQRMTSHI